MGGSPKIESTQKWVKNVVIGLNLCPFAKREIDNSRVRFIESFAKKEQDLLEDLHRQFVVLDDNPNIETTLIVLDDFLYAFDDFNQFLNVIDGFIESLGYSGIYQVASFHPLYQFEGTDEDAVENYTNRSPYPILHIIREASLEIAIASHPDIKSVPTNNIKLMNDLGIKKLQTLLKECF